MVTKHIFFALLCAASFFTGHSEKQNPSVIIIGSGPAGIAAATKLLENAITNITILEAENRIGGRIKSVEFDNGHLDMGAQFCHGQEGNVVYELVKDLDLLQPSITPSSKSIKIYDSSGTLAQSDITDDLVEIIIGYEDDIRPKTDNDSLKEAVSEKYKQTILEKYKSDKNKFKLAKDGIETVGKIILHNEAAFTWESVSAKNHGEGCDGDQQMSWKSRGYHRILEVLMKSYPNPSEKLPIDDKFSLNKTVVKIIWNQNKAIVQTSDNSSLTADHVIFTPSVGVLKKHKNTLFEPELPPEKHLALDAIGFDGVGKIFLHFPEKWWNNEVTAFFMFWNEEDLSKIKDEFSAGPSKNDILWVTRITVFATVPSHPNVLVAWVGGKLMPDIERASDDEIQRGAMYVIRKFLGKDYNVTEPDQILRSQWVTNPNFLGTWSYDNVGYYKENVSYQAILSEPLTNRQNPVVLFAGEATNPKHAGSVHGAIETGRREAQRIIDLHK